MRYLIYTRPEGHYQFRAVDKDLNRVQSLDDAFLFSYETTIEKLSILRDNGISAKIKNFKSGKFRLNPSKDK